MKSLLLFILFLSISSFALNVIGMKTQFSEHRRKNPSDDEKQKEWKEFKKHFKKEYKDNEDSTRYENWLRSKEEVDQWKGPWKKVLNKMSDLSTEEKQKYYLNNKVNRLEDVDTPPPVPIPSSFLHSKTKNIIAETELLTTEEAISKVNAPTTVDWRNAGKVTPVKDQGQCGSCWAFAASAALESMNLIFFQGTNATSDFSEQQLVDCNAYELGCNGGNTQRSVNWNFFNGVADESVYPYYSSNTFWTPNAVQCSSSSTRPISLGADSIKMNDVTTMIAKLAQQPLVVFVDATPWLSYGGGVLSQCSASSQAGNHFVLLVGYTETAWIIKNSWGSDWGENGYIYLDRSNLDCQTMLSNYASYPLSAGKPDVLSSSTCAAYKSYGYCRHKSYVNYMTSIEFFFLLC